jgi:hypothetical protein
MVKMEFRPRDIYQEGSSKLEVIATSLSPPIRRAACRAALRYQQHITKCEASAKVLAAKKSSRSKGPGTVKPEFGP